MRKQKDFIFTNKKHSPKAIMSTVLGAIAVVSLLTASYLSYRSRGSIDARFGAVCVVAMIFAAVGVILGILGRLERECFYRFAYLGIVLNLLAFGLLSCVLYAGALL